MIKGSFQYRLPSHVFLRGEPSSNTGMLGDNCLCQKLLQERGAVCEHGYKKHTSVVQVLWNVPNEGQSGEEGVRERGRKRERARGREGGQGE